jgi:hypothetical protein
MKIQLLIGGQLSGCLEARDIWQQACEKQKVQLEVLELEEPQGHELATRLGLKSFPVLIADEKVRAVGRPTEEDATAILQELNKK